MVQSDSETSLTLLEILRQDPGNEEAWGEFVRRYRPTITSWCRDWGLQDADAEDVTQNVFLKLSEKMRSFRYDPARSFRGWLKTIAKHAASDFAASQQRGAGSGDSKVYRVLQTVEARSGLAQQLDAAFDLELLEVAMRQVRQRVEPRTWEVFQLMRQQGLSGAAVGHRLAMPVANVFMALHRVQKMLAEELSMLKGPDEA